MATMREKQPSWKAVKNMKVLPIVVMMLCLTGCGSAGKFSLSDYVQERRTFFKQETVAHAPQYYQETLDMCLDNWTSGGTVEAIWDNLYANYDINKVVMLIEAGSYAWSKYSCLAILKVKEGYRAVSIELSGSLNVSIDDTLLTKNDIDTFVAFLESDHQLSKTESDFGSLLAYDAACTFFMLDYGKTHHRFVLYNIECCTSVLTKEMMSYIESVFTGEWHLSRERIWEILECPH